jgi:predicted nucleic acid-binding protein
MSYLIDSDWVIDQLAAEPAAVQLLAQLAPAGIAISVISLMEVLEGVLRSADPRQQRADLNTFLTNVPVLPFSEAVAERCAQVRDALRRQNRRVNSRAVDLMIAATALEYGLTLVTRNTSDYRDIPGLTLH